MGIRLNGEYDFIGIVNREIFVNHLVGGFYCTGCQGNATKTKIFTISGPNKEEITVFCRKIDADCDISIQFNTFCNDKIKKQESLIKIIAKKSCDYYMDMIGNIMNDVYPIILKCPVQEACSTFRKEILNELNDLYYEQHIKDVLMIDEVTVKDMNENYRIKVIVKIGGVVASYYNEFLCSGMYVEMDKETSSKPIVISDVEVKSLNTYNLESEVLIENAIRNALRKYRFIPVYS